MINLIKFEPSHLRGIIATAGTTKVRPWMNDSLLSTLSSQQYCYTIMDDNGPLMCGGLVNYWSGRYEAWAVLDAVPSSKFLIVHRKVRDFFNAVELPRIEAVVESSCIGGRKWVEKLGFTLEVDTMSNYGVNGESFSLYSRVM